MWGSEKEERRFEGACIWTERYGEILNGNVENVRHIYASW